MMIDDRDLLRRRHGHIAFSVLTVGHEQKLRPFLQFGDKLNRNLKRFHHECQIAFGNFELSPVDKAHLFTLFCEIAVQTVSGSNGIRIRIVMALYDNFIKLQQLLQSHTFSPPVTFFYRFLLSNLPVQGTVRRASPSGLQACGLPLPEFRRHAPASFSRLRPPEVFRS